jgi:hypothetical protein
MRAARFIFVCASALLFAGCDDEGEVTLAPVVPLAFTRFVNAVPDTMGSDWRFVDQLENSPDWFNLTFRQFTPFRATAPGARRLKVFPKSTDINVTQQHFVDTTLTFAENAYYTIVHVGNTRTGSATPDHIVLIEDPIPTIPANQVAVRAMHLGTGQPALDVFETATTTSTLPATPTFSNVAFESATQYVLQDTAAFAFRATPTGSTTPVLASGAAPAGVAANPALGQTTIGGARMGGSAILGIFMPRSVAGSQAPQTSAFTSPAWVYLIDRHPR